MTGVHRIAATIAALGTAIGFAWLTSTELGAQTEEQRTIADEDLQSGYAFQSDDTRALQDDDFANPGFLWVDKGEALFAEKAGDANKACTECHNDGNRPLRGAAVHYPMFDREADTLINLEQRINLCRTRHQEADALEYESDDLLALTTFVAHQSRGQPFDIQIAEKEQTHFENGRRYYFTRRGQLNLACNHCHDQNWGEMLRGDRLSQGHNTGYPAYRFDWENQGSLHRRLRNCDVGVRAEPLPFGDQTYVDVELYLAWRAKHLPIETPSVRR